MQLIKKIIIWLTIFFLAYFVGLNIVIKEGTARIELIFVSIFAFSSYSRAFLIDKILRQIRNQEIVPFSLFLFEIPLIKLFSLLVLVIPFYTVTQNEETEVTRRKINMHTYIIYFVVVASIILNIIK